MNSGAARVLGLFMVSSMLELATRHKARSIFILGVYFGPSLS